MPTPCSTQLPVTPAPGDPPDTLFWPSGMTVLTRTYSLTPLHSRANIKSLSSSSLTLVLRLAVHNRNHSTPLAEMVVLSQGQPEFRVRSCLKHYQHPHAKYDSTQSPKTEEKLRSFLVSPAHSPGSLSCIYSDTFGESVAFSFLWRKIFPL